MAERPLAHVVESFRTRLQSPSTDGSTDRQLLERFVHQRDEAAFAALVQRHTPLVLGVSRRILFRQQDAEDVFQATFLNLALQASTSTWEHSLAGWLYCVAYRLALRTRTDNCRRWEFEKRCGQSVEAKEESHRRDLYAALDDELHQISHPCREAILLCYFEGKTRDQAARQLGWSLRTLERRLEQGLKLLRARLHRRGIEAPLALLMAGLSHQAISAATTRALASSTVDTIVRFQQVASGAQHLLSPGVNKLLDGGIVMLARSSLRYVLITLGTLGMVATGALLFGMGLIGRNSGDPTDDPSTGPAVALTERQDLPGDTPSPKSWPEGATVVGRVLDSRGAPVANAEVLLLGSERILVEANRTWLAIGRQKDSPKPPSTRTNGKGEFRITRQHGTADRILVLAPDPLFWSTPRTRLAATGPVEIKLPESGRLSVHCQLPGKEARQPLMIELQSALPEGDFLRFDRASYSVSNPGQAVFERLPPGDYSVQRAINTPMGKLSVLETFVDRQLVKVAPQSEATVTFERKVGQRRTGIVRGLEKGKWRYALVEISTLGPEERLPNGKMGRMQATFDVISIKEDGNFTTDPIPPGKYTFRLSAVSDAVPEHQIGQPDYHGSITVTIPDRGEMPPIEIVAQPIAPNVPRRKPENQLRAVDAGGKPVPTVQAFFHTQDHGYLDWTEGRSGLVGFGNMGLFREAKAMDVFLRAEGYSSSLLRLSGPDLEALRQGTTTVRMKQGTKVELRFSVPKGLVWPEGLTLDTYFAELEYRVRILRQPGNRRPGKTYDFNILNAREIGPGHFEMRLDSDTPPFFVAIHAPGFLQHFEAGPFTLADVKDGVLKVDLPRPATLQVQFDPGTQPPAELPFSAYTLEVMRHLQGDQYLVVASNSPTAMQDAWNLTDLAPGKYLVGVTTKPRVDIKPIPGTEIHPGLFSDRKYISIAAGATEKAHMRYQPYDPQAFRGRRTATVRLRHGDGRPVAGQEVTVDYVPGHYGSLPIFKGLTSASGEITLRGLTDQSPSFWPRSKAYRISMNGRLVSFFGFAATSTSTDKGGKPPVPAVGSTQSEATQIFEISLAPQRGDLAPKVALQNAASGALIPLEALRGQIVCLEFWQTTCGPCQPAMGKFFDLAESLKTHRNGALTLLPVSLDENRQQALSHALRRGWKGLESHWSGEAEATGFDAPAAQAFGITRVPETILIGRDGRLLWRGHPDDSDDGHNLRTRIEAALKGNLK